MLTGHLEGRFLKMLVAISGARRILEIGTYTGYSAMSMAEALPEDGKLISCESTSVTPNWRARHIATSPDQPRSRCASVGRWTRSRDSKALSTWSSSTPTRRRTARTTTRRCRFCRHAASSASTTSCGPCGSCDPSDNDPSTVAFRDLNDYIASDPRVECVMVPIRDGVTIVRRADFHRLCAAPRQSRI